MNRTLVLVLTALFIAVTMPGLAQPGITQPNQADQDHLFLNNEFVVPPSSEPANLGQFGEYDVNKYTGSHNINIPIYSMGGTDVQAAVSLNYSGSAHKVSAPVGWTGLGWSINSGGVISRVVNGDPDMNFNYYDKAATIASNVIIGNNQFDEYDFMYDAAQGQVETQPDFYYYNFNGRAGKFYISPYKEVIQEKYGDIIIVPGFASNGDIERFTITDEKGTIYLFDVREETHVEYDDVSTSVFSRIPAAITFEYNSSWHLQIIQSHNQDEDIIFSYLTASGDYEIPLNNSQYVSRSYRSCTNSMQSGPTSGILSELAAPFQSVIKNRRHISKITLRINGTTIESLDFISSTNALGHPIPTDRKLDKIQLRKFGVLQSRNWQLGYDAITGRLSLRTFKENAGSADINEYSFDYDAVVLPSPTSNGIDHWGYYNGRSANQDLLPSYNFVTNTYSTINREPSFLHMKAGMMSKITYPTKGYSTFFYEQNQTPEITSTTSYEPICSFGTHCFVGYTSCPVGTGNCCRDIGGTPDSNEETYLVTITQEMIDDGFLEITATNVCDSGGESSVLISYEIEFLDLSHNPIQSYAQSFNDADGFYFERIDLSSTFSALTAGTSYHMKLSGIETLIEVDFVKQLTTTNENNVNRGGARIQEIKTYSATGSVLNHKEYKYQRTATSAASSGKLLDLVEYRGISYYEYFSVNTLPASNDPQYSCNTLTLSTTSVTELGTVQGSPVSYSRVEEISYDDSPTPQPIGSTVSYFYNDGYEPGAVEATLNGQVESEELFINDSETGDKVQEVIYTYSYGSNDHTRNVNFWGYKVNSTENQDNQKFLFFDGTDYRWTEEINIADDFPPFQERETKLEKDDFKRYEEYYLYPKSKITTDFHYNNAGQLTGQLTTTQNFEYSSPDHLQIMKEQTINSDNEEFSTEYKYATDIASTVNSQLVLRNIFAPIETVQKVGNLQVDGRRIPWKNFAGKYFPHKVERYEMTWDENGLPDVDGWQVATTFNSYGPEGRPLSMTRAGWPSATSFSWTNSGKLSSWTYNAFTKSYTYNSKDLVEKVTDVDGTSTSYLYDNFFRLTQAKDDQRQVTQDYVYQFKSGAIPNQIRVKTTYPELGEDTQVELWSKTNYDDIGRPYQSIQLNQGSSNTKSVVSSSEYDQFGRVIKEFEPIEVSGITVTNFANQNVALTSHTDFTLSEYEESPKSRMKSSTMPGWSASMEYEITVNNTSDEVLKDPTVANVYWTTGTLTKSITTDEDGNKDIVFTDKVGRDVMVRRENSTGSKTLDTYQVYDDKNRIETIYPPGTTPYVAANHANLIYKMEYYGNDLLKTKELPDQDGINEYRYNQRDLLAFWRDPNLEAQDKWVHINYDIYGQPVLEGFYADGGALSTSTQVNNPTSTLFEFKRFTEYDIDKMSKRIDDTNLGHWFESYMYDNARRVSSKMLDRTVNVSFNNAQSIDVANVSYTFSNYSVAAPAKNEISYSYDSKDNQLAKLFGLSPAGTSTAQTAIEMQADFDFAGRLKEEKAVFYSANGGQPLAVTGTLDLGQYTYTAKSEVASIIHSKGNGQSLFQTDFDYLANGFLKSIEATGGASVGYFNAGYEYDNKTSNGNISGILEAAATFVNRFDYTYDFSNRLTDVSNTQGGSNKSTTYNYDDRGNFETLTRNNGGLIDNLDYTYPMNGSVKTSNRMIDINDLDQDAEGFPYYNLSTNDSYDYDKNGNITYDPSRDVHITYNHLNLPVTFTKDSEVMIYQYTFDGQLLHKFDPEETALQRIRTYIDEFEFDRGGRLDLVKHSTGYIANREICETSGNIVLNESELANYEYNGKTISSSSDVYSKELTYKANDRITLTDDFRILRDPANGSPEMLIIVESLACQNVVAFEDFKPYYTIKDHLGNTRLVIHEDNDNPTVHNAITYYPFGLESEILNSTTSFKYLYNGKEKQDDLGLGYYNYGARFYDPTIGRFTSVDALADHPNQVAKSPYAYAWNNPINLTDPDGNCPLCDIIINKGIQFFQNNDVSLSVGLKLDFGLQGTFSNKYVEANIDAGTVELGEAELSSDSGLEFDYFKKDGEIEVTRGAKIGVGLIDEGIGVGVGVERSFTQVVNEDCNRCNEIKDDKTTFSNYTKVGTRNKAGSGSTFDSDKVAGQSSSFKLSFSQKIALFLGIEIKAELEIKTGGQ